jgi:hypothetical protein
MYKDVNGRIHTKLMRTASGKTIGDLTLLKPDELQAALDDGITVYVAPPPPEPDPADVLRQQQAQIKLQAERDMDAIAPLREQVTLLAEYVQLLEDKVDGTTYDQARKDELKAKKDQIKGIRAKAAQDISAL